MSDVYKRVISSIAGLLLSADSLWLLSQDKIHLGILLPPGDWRFTDYLRPVLFLFPAMAAALQISLQYMEIAMDRIFYLGRQCPDLLWLYSKQYQ